MAGFNASFIRRDHVRPALAHYGWASDGITFGHRDRDRGEFSLKALVDLTVRKQRGKKPWLAKPACHETSVPGEKLVYVRWAKLSGRSTFTSIGSSTILDCDLS